MNYLAIQQWLLGFKLFSLSIKKFKRFLETYFLVKKNSYLLLETKSLINFTDSTFITLMSFVILIIFHVPTLNNPILTVSLKKSAF